MRGVARVSAQGACPLVNSKNEFSWPPIFWKFSFSGFSCNVIQILTWFLDFSRNFTIDPLFWEILNIYVICCIKKRRNNMHKNNKILIFSIFVNFMNYYCFLFLQHYLQKGLKFSRKRIYSEISRGIQKSRQKFY